MQFTESADSDICAAAAVATDAVADDGTHCINDVDDVFWVLYAMYK